MLFSVGNYFSTHSRHGGRAGYTAIELIVVAAIMVVISSIVLVGFGSLNATTALNQSARDLAVIIRRAQNKSLSVSGIPEIGNEVPPAIGIQLTKNAGSYILFADRASSRDNKYLASSGELIATQLFQRGVTVVRFLDANGNEIISTSVLHVIFSAPEANPVVTDANGAGNSTWSKVDIVLRSPSGRERTITVRESGQISVQ
jgi:prepilin-type N-terminal cleavage/methylation domain-containing protein